MKRTDIHRTSQVTPADYEFVAFGYMKIDFFGGVDPTVILLQRERMRLHMERTGGKYSDHEHGGSCHICGASAIYTVIFYHAKTNTYIKTGNDCAEKLEMSYGDFNAFTRAIQNAREAYAGKKKAAALLADRGLSRCWDIYAFDGSYEKREEMVIRDVVEKLVKYGSISENQYNLLTKLVDAIDNRAVIEAKRKAEAEAAAPCPEGRLEVSGEILYTRVEDTDFGRTTKMLFRADAGFKLWGTMPSGADGKGARIVFRAHIMPSKDDPKSGFFKRPHLISSTLPQEVA